MAGGGVGDVFGGVLHFGGVEDLSCGSGSLWYMMVNED